MTGPDRLTRRAPVEVRRRGWFEVRWRQFRRAPRPVFRAVVTSLTVAIVVGVAFLAYDVALDRGAVLPGGDLRLLVLTGYVAIVLVAGALITWLVVPLPTGSGTAGRPGPRGARRWGCSPRCRSRTSSWWCCTRS